MEKKTIYITLAILAIAAAAYYFYNKKKVNADATAAPTPAPMGSVSSTTAEVQATPQTTTLATVIGSIPVPALFAGGSKGPAKSNVGKPM